MIRIIKGIYGMHKDGAIVPVAAGAPPFSLTKREEEQLVERGVAAYCEKEDTGSKEKKKDSKEDDDTPPAITPKGAV